ncbi:MAG: membrane protein insertase YidC [Candidatus Omnitrophica bacterium]|nr:membrane protein insertase YidC [Candidatus Omnitrophota bacterium]
MSSEKRFFLAVGLSFLILVVYPIYLKWITPKSISGPGGAAEPYAVEPKREVDLKAVPGGEAEVAEETVERTEKVYPFAHKFFQAEFSERGGAITKLELKSWGKQQKSEVLIRGYGTSVGALLVSLPNQGVDFRERHFSLQTLDEQKGEVEFYTAEPGKWRLVKKFRFSEENPVIQLEVTVENLNNTQLILPIEVTTQIDVESKMRDDKAQAESFVFLADKLTSSHLGKIEKTPYIVEGKILWQALSRKYFAIIISPGEPAALSKTTAARKEAEFMENTLQLPPAEINPSALARRSFLIYAGPKYYRELKSFGENFEQILSHGFFGIFRLWLLVGFEWTRKLVGNYGWAIILITFAIKLLFTPLTHMSFESMKKMQALQPKLKALQERYKGDQAKLSQEMMQLYKRNKVNPMGGCLPMVLQIPIFIAFYQVLDQTVELKGEPFIFWIRDLSAPDRAWTLPFALPFLGDAVNVLPLLMLGSMVWQQKLTPQTGTPDQQRIMMIMPVVFGFIFYSMPSGLVLYWFVNNMLSIFHQLFIKGKALPHHEEA